MSEINLKDVQQKLYEKLKPSGWDKLLRSFILSQEFYNILDRLLLESNAGDNFTPVIKNLFRAFEECPYDKLSVVVVGQDPYPKQDVADGIAFSCSNSNIQASLRYIFTGLDGEGIEHDKGLDLAKWSNQGVLMLNTALTTRIGKIGTHVELWKPFMIYLMDMLQSNTGLIYIFMGKKAEGFLDYVDQDLNYPLVTSHPASAAYSKLKQWDSKGVFTETNRILKEINNGGIKW
jgi:uracil-DNA glycosylase